MKKLSFLFLFIIVLGGGYTIFKNPSYEIFDITEALEITSLTLKENQEIITFSSKNPFNFYEIIHNLNELPDQEVFGILTLPEKEGVFPLIIGAAGSHGWADHHYGYLKRYLDMGIGVLSLHSFKSRTVESTVGKQLSVTMAMMIYDAFMALETLSQDARIDPNNIGITGWSLGGGVALFSAWKPIQTIISPDYTFAAHLPIYPPCMIKPEIMEFTDAPIHILIGELDNWVPAQPCVEIVDEMQELGFDIKITVYPDSHHSFDREQELLLLENAYSFTDCRLKLTDDGVVRTNNIGFPLSTPMLQKIGLAFCADRGATYGGNDFAREHSSEFAKEFMSKYLLN